MCIKIGGDGSKPCTISGGNSSVSNNYSARIDCRYALKLQVLNGNPLRGGKSTTADGGVTECKGDPHCREEAVGRHDGDTATLYVTVHTSDSSNTVPLIFRKGDNFEQARLQCTCQRPTGYWAARFLYERGYWNLSLKCGCSPGD